MLAPQEERSPEEAAKVKEQRDEAMMRFMERYPSPELRSYLREVWQGDGDPANERKGFKAGMLYLHDLHNDAGLRRQGDFQARFDHYYAQSEEQLEAQLSQLKSISLSPPDWLQAGSLPPTATRTLEHLRTEIFDKRQREGKPLLS